MSKDHASCSQSQRSIVTYTPKSHNNCGKKNIVAPLETRRVTRRSPLAPSLKKKKAPETSGPSKLVDVTTASAFTKVRMSIDSNSKHDYKDATIAYKKFWSTCTDVYIYEIDTKLTLPIDRLESARAH